MIQYRRQDPSGRNSRLYRRATILLLAALYLFNLYRAATQSITSDEAFAESLFLDGHLSRLFSSYDASHHVLHTLLTKASVLAFGLSEFTLRIPSLLGGLLLVATVYRIARHVFGEGRQMLLAAALVSLNPLVMDFMSAARGYGLAVALLLWALLQMLLYTGGDQDTSRIYKAGLGLGLSAAANLTLLVPGTALAAVFMALLLKQRRSQALLDCFVVPGMVTAFVIVILPLTKATRGNFYVGLPALDETLRNLVALSMFHHWLPPRVAAVLPRPEFWYTAFGYVLVPAVLGGAAVASAVVLLRWFKSGEPAGMDGPSRLLLLGGGSLVLSTGILAALHRAFEVPYPTGRTGLYLIVLFSFTVLALPASLRKSRTAFLLAGGPVWALGVVWVGTYALHLDTRYYGEWIYDASTKRIVNVLGERQRERPAANVRLGVSWMLEPSLNFYRRVYKLTWMAPVERKDPDGDYDYYVLLEGDAPLIQKRGLRVLYSNSVSGVWLAEPGPRR